jgi:hypothetical protein
MHLRTAHRWTTTHLGGRGAKNAHKNNVAQVQLSNKKDMQGLGNRMKIVSPQGGLSEYDKRIGILFQGCVVPQPGAAFTSGASL